MTGSGKMYQALYRKYRPKNFEEVVSQKAILQTLKNSIQRNHIGHAYLFSGPRGTGKTTVAKIFARAVNCLDNQNENICEHCDSCNYSRQKECMDIIEIDAASNNGINEIRELRSKVNILPSELKYKVYIIDEVHMLSLGAFNALLKTLEEPPKHVIFILATTDPQKIPATIISRCQCYNFKKISNHEIIEQLSKIAKEENIEIEQEALEAIATAADGGLRDAVGLLDKVRAYQENKITLDDFLQINGQIRMEELSSFEQSFFGHSAKEVLEKVNQYYEDGKDLIQVLKQLMFYLKNELVDYYIKDIPLKQNEQETIEFINLLNEKLMEIKRADDTKMYIEIMLLNFINHHEKEQIISREIISPSAEEKTEKKPVEVTVEKEEKKEEPKNETPKIENNIRQTMITQEKERMTIRSKNTMAEAVKQELAKEQINFEKLNDFTFDTKQGYLACELLDGKPRASSNDKLVISYEYDTLIEKMMDHIDKLISFYHKVTGSTKLLAFISDSEWEQLKKEYIHLIKDGKNFPIQEEPKKVIIEKEEQQETATNEEKYQEVIELFGKDIVEIK